MKFYLLFLFLSSAYSYELIKIQSVSRSGQTFVTRHGKKDGVILGKRGTFTSDNVSVVARAITVSRDFTQWEVQNQIIDTPFEKGDFITYYDAKEYLWTLTPENLKRKYIKKYIHENKNYIGLHSSLSRGLSQSVTGSEATDSERGSILFELFYERDFSRYISGAIGFRYEREVINVPEASLITTRAMGLADLRFYFPKLQSFFDSKAFLGIGVGYGDSGTSTSVQIISGKVSLLPALKGGLVIPMRKRFDFVVEVGLDSLQSLELDAQGKKIESTSSNFKYGGGIKYSF